VSDAPARSVPARIGLAALNLLVPGLGLWRIGRWRPALRFMLLPLFAIVALALTLAKAICL
jgi:hypothetical protein